MQWMDLTLSCFVRYTRTKRDRWGLKVWRCQCQRLNLLVCGKEKNVASLVRPDPRFWTPRLKRKKGFTLFRGSQAPARHPLAGRPPPYFLGRAGAVSCRAVLPPQDRTAGRDRRKQPKTNKSGGQEDIGGSCPNPRLSQ